MAMRVKPTGQKDPEIVGISGSLLTIYSDKELDVLRQAVRGAVGVSIPTSKYKPSKAKAKKKRSKKAVKQKDMESCNKVAAKPSLPTVVNDDERYAMWWSFHTNFVQGEYPTYKGVKVHPIDSSSREKMKAKSNQLRSLSSKNHIRNKQAVGITPRRHANTPNLLGNCCHPSDRSRFDEVVTSNKSYEKELVARGAAALSIQRCLPWLTHAYNTDHILSSTLPKERVQIKHTSEVNLGDMIYQLEKHIEESTSTEPVVMARDAVPWDTSDVSDINVNLAATAEVFDMNPEDVLPSALDPLHMSTTGVPIVEQEQRSTPAEVMYDRRFEPWHGDEEIAYCRALSRMEECSTNEYNLPIGSYEISRSEYREESARYMRTLSKHKADYVGRVYMESRRRVADPAYPLQLGMEVPVLYHGNAWVWDHFVEYRNRSRIRAFDDGTLDNMGAGEWYNYTKFKVDPKMVIDTEQVHKEILAEKLIENALARRTDAANDESITVSEDSPTPMTDAIFNKWAQERAEREAQGAEVVDLASIRNKRNTDIKGLIPKINSILEGLTEEEEKKVRDYIDMLIQARG